MRYLKNFKGNLVLLMSASLLSACGTSNPIIVSSSIQANADLMAPEQDQSYLEEMDRAVCPLIGCMITPDDAKKPDKKLSGFNDLFGL